MHQISAETDNFHLFLTKFAQKGYFQLKTDAKNIAIEFCIFELDSGSKFYPEQTNLNFSTEYAQKRYLGSKPKNVNPH